VLSIEVSNTQDKATVRPEPVEGLVRVVTGPLRQAQDRLRQSSARTAAGRCL